MTKTLTTISAVMLHLAIGSVYAWSILVDPIHDFTGWSILSLILVFSVTILCLGLTASLLGNKVKSAHPGKLSALVLVLFLAGMILSSAALHYRIFTLLLVGYGVFIGIATGIGYLLPIPIIMTWYTRFKGIATGMVIAAFGFSSLMAAYGYHWCIITIGIEKAPAIVGGILSVLILPSIFFLRSKKVIVEEMTEEQISTCKAPFSNVNFRQLWMLFFINISIGISVVSCLAPMTKQLFNITGIEVAMFVGTIGLVNGFSRFCWAFLSDFIGRPITVAILIAFELTAILSLIHFQEFHIYKSCIFVIIACYGGMFALMPNYIADLFGTANVKSIFSHILSAWGLAGLIAPVTLRLLYEHYGNYANFFYSMLVLCCINFFIGVILTERNINRI